MVVANFYDCDTTIDLSNYKIKNLLTSNYDDFLNENGVITIRPFESFVIDVNKKRSNPNEVK